MRHDPVALLRHALHSDDAELADALIGAFRGDDDLARRADALLGALPRRPAQEARDEARAQPVVSALRRRGK